MTTVNTPHRRKKSRVWPAFILVILVAFFFRFYRLADHPLGIFFDPAINGLDTVRLIQRGGYVLFFPTNGGRESLFMVLLIPFIRLFGTTPLALRALTATISLLTVALLFAFLRSMRCLNFDKSPKTDLPLQTNNLQLAVLAGLALATLYWHIAISRLGQRPILVPMLAVPLFWFFLKGWATGQKKWFILAGVFMGLEGYTYSAARLLPVILLLAILPEFFLDGFYRTTKKHLINLLIFAGTALVIYLPMAWYLLTHPAQFTARAGSVMVWNFLDTPADIVTEIGQNTLRVLGFFCCAGSPNPIFGLPGWPGLSILLTPFLLIGLIVAFTRWWHLFYRLVVIWWFIGILPAFIAIEAPHPLRMIVAVVPTAILVGLGLVWGFSWLGGKVSGVRCQVPGIKCQVSGVRCQVPGAKGQGPGDRYLAPHPAHRALRTTFYFLPFFLILATIPGTFRAYFMEWTQRRDTQGVYDYGAVAIRDAISNHTTDDIPLYLPLARFNTSTLLYYLSGPYQRQAKTTVMPADQAMLIAPERNEQDATWVRLYQGFATILPPLTPQGQQLMQSALAGEARSIQTPGGETVARLFTLAADPAQFLQQPTRLLEASFGPVVLTGINYEMSINPPTETFPVTLFWQAAAPMKEEYEVLLQLVDDKRRVRGDGSGRPNDWAYPTTFWRPGVDEIASQHIVKLENNNLQPGRYWLAVALFNPATQQRLPLIGGSDSPDTLFVGPLKVPLPPPENVPPAIDPVDFDKVARLLALEVNPPTIIAGQPISLLLLWQSLSSPERDYTVFVHLLDENNNLVAGHDAQPLNGLYPTSIWASGEQILDAHTLPTPGTLPPGQYRLAIGLYHQPTGERLPLTGGLDQPHPDGQLILPNPIIVN